MTNESKVSTMITPKTSLLQTHINKWTKCTECLLSKQRTKVVIARGEVPAKVAYVGEAPGQSEDVLGEPFVGPAGILMDAIIKEAHAEYMSNTGNPEPKTVIFNVVGCFPRDAKESDNHQPPAEALKSCNPRVTEFLDLCRPRLIVMVGKTAEKWVPIAMKNMAYDPFVPIQVVAINHPSFILRTVSAQQSLLIQKAVVTISNALEDIGPDG